MKVNKTSYSKEAAALLVLAALTHKKLKKTAKKYRDEDDLDERLYKVVQGAKTEAKERVSTKPAPDTKSRQKVVKAAIESFLVAYGAAYVVSKADTVQEKARQAIELTDYRLKRLASTEVFHAFNRQVIKVAKRVRWNSELDARVCPICADLEGREFDVKDAPMCPNHPNCRCFLEQIN